MDEDRAVLVEKIIKELNHVISKTGLNDFDIVAAESNKNKSPVLFEELSVGLESWCIKPVYMYCYKELMETYFTNPKNRFNTPSYLNQERLTTLLNTALLINPDVTTFWNKRREMFLKKLLEWTSELQFTKLVLSRKPKCNEAFVYRKWILEDVLRRELHPLNQLEDIITEELLICNMTADKCANNYHSWDYRRWVMDTAWRYRLEFEYSSIFYSDYRDILAWSSTHITDYSALHYRQFLLKKLYYIERRGHFEREIGVNLHQNLQKLITLHIPNCSTIKPHKTFNNCYGADEIIALLIGHCPGNCICYGTIYSTLQKIELLFYELVVNDELLQFYKGHETLWRHRKFIVFEIYDAMCTQLEIESKGFRRKQRSNQITRCSICHNANLSQHQGKVETNDILWVFMCPLYKVMMRHEKELIKERRKDGDIYADKHAQFLKTISISHYLDRYPVLQ